MNSYARGYSSRTTDGYSNKKSKILGVGTVVKQITRLMYVDMVLLLNVMSVMSLVTNLNFVMYIIIVR